MIWERVWLALHQPATWYAIATGAGVFGVPVGWAVAWWRGRRLTGYDVGFTDGVKSERGRWASTVLCAREWSFSDIGEDGETLPPHTLAEWVEHAQRRHGPFRYSTEASDAD